MYINDHYQWISNQNFHSLNDPWFLSWYHWACDHFLRFLDQHHFQLFVIVIVNWSQSFVGRREMLWGYMRRRSLMRLLLTLRGHATCRYDLTVRPHHKQCLLTKSGAYLGWGFGSVRVSLENEGDAKGVYAT